MKNFETSRIDSHLEANNLEQETAEILESLEKIEESSLFEDEQFEDIDFLVFQKEKPFILKIENKVPTISLPEDPKTLRNEAYQGKNNLVIVSTRKTFEERFSSPEKLLETEEDHTKALSLLALSLYDITKISYEEFLTHEIAHRDFDENYLKKFKEYKEDEKGETKLQEEYQGEISQKIHDILSKSGITENDIQAIKLSRRAVCEVYALMFQREYAKRTRKFEHHHEVSQNFQLLLQNFPEKINKTEVLSESHIFSYLLVPLLEKEYPDFEDRKKWFGPEQ